MMSARNLCSNGKTTVHSVCIAELLVTVRIVKILNVLSKVLIASLSYRQQ